MDRKKFEQLVEDSLKEIPTEFKKYIENLTVIVEDVPPIEAYEKTGTSTSHMILGTYHGVPFKHRGPYYGNLPPDVITIYQKPIESICFTDEEIKEKVKEVVIHEIGHYFGMTDTQMRKYEGK